MNTDEKKPFILLAEDNPNNFMLFDIILRKKFQLVHAKNGIEAVNLFKEHSLNLNLVLMDIKMPEKDGLEAMKEIKSIAPDFPVLALTAMAYQDEIDNLLDSGFDDYIEKPINKQVMLESIEKWLK